MRVPGFLPPGHMHQGPMEWYALWALTNSEFVVADALRAHGIDVFVPTWTDVTQWSDRRKEVVRPLFRGYLFARCEQRAFPAILEIAGMIDILPSSIKPVSVDAAEIENVRRALNSGLQALPCQYITGQEVLIDAGPLAGVRGIVQRTKNGTRVVVKIELLQRAVSVEVDSRDLVAEHQQEKKAA